MTIVIIIVVIDKTDRGKKKQRMTVGISSSCFRKLKGGSYISSFVSAFKTTTTTYKKFIVWIPVKFRRVESRKIMFEKPKQKYCKGFKSLHHASKNYHQSFSCNFFFCPEEK
jgi:hypothetical protein